jgi:hypothetical protein
MAFPYVFSPTQIVLQMTSSLLFLLPPQVSPASPCSRSGTTRAVADRSWSPGTRGAGAGQTQSGLCLEIGRSLAVSQEVDARFVPVVEARGAKRRKKQNTTADGENIVDTK